MDIDKAPSPRELVRAHRTLARLRRAIGIDEVRDMDGTDVWSGLVEGRRMLAVATAALGSQDERYEAAWERMLVSD